MEKPRLDSSGIAFVPNCFKQSFERYMAASRKSSSATRERILRAAERCFTEHGFEGSSLRQITRMARVNLAAVNYHFSSKRELWLEMMQRRLGPLNAERVRLIEAARAATPPGSPLSLEQICEAMVMVAVVISPQPAWWVGPSVCLRH